LAAKAALAPRLTAPATRARTMKLSCMEVSDSVDGGVACLPLSAGARPD